MRDLSDLEKRVVDMMVEKMQLAPPPVDADLFETGYLDSLSFVSLLVHIEEEFGMRIDLKDLDLSRFQCIAGIAAFIAAHAQVQTQAPAHDAKVEDFLFRDASLGYAG